MAVLQQPRFWPRCSSSESKRSASNPAQDSLTMRRAFLSCHAPALIMALVMALVIALQKVDHCWKELSFAIPFASLIAAL